VQRTWNIGILSDIHYAGPLEQARGDGYEAMGLGPVTRALLQCYRRYIWLHQPLRKGYLLDRFLERADNFDCLVANGDYSCDSVFTGLSDDGAFESARIALGKLRARYGANFQANFGDHELGKLSFLGRRGGMRLASWQRAISELDLKPFWTRSFGGYRLMGIVSSLVALPVFAPDILPEERAGWETLRADHLARIRDAFGELPPDCKVILFCHDPTALPFLWREPAVRARADQIEQTIIGHLHSPLILWKSRVLAGMPVVRVLGHSIQRFSTALREARHWKPFKVRLCPSLAGIELLKDGGYYVMELEASGKTPARFIRHKLPR
jgi:hypothetical protein